MPAICCWPRFRVCYSRLSRTYLDYIDSDVIKHHVYLSYYEVRGYKMNVFDALGVLRSQCCGRCHCIAKMVGKNFLVSLKPPVVRG